MKNSFKAVLATSAAAFLLVGGAGTLAYWESSDTAAAADITAGTLKLTDPKVGGWKLNGETVADPAAVRVVPGDELDWSGSFVIQASGDNLEGTLTVTGGNEGEGGLSPHVETTTSWTLDGATHTGPVTAAHDGDVIAVTIDITFPFGEAVDNTSQALALDLTDISVNLKQTEAVQG